MVKILVVEAEAVRADGPPSDLEVYYSLVGSEDRRQRRNNNNIAFLSTN